MVNSGTQFGKVIIKVARRVRAGRAQGKHSSLVAGPHLTFEAPQPTPASILSLHAPPIRLWVCPTQLTWGSMPSLVSSPCAQHRAKAHFLPRIHRSTHGSLLSLYLTLPHATLGPGEGGGLTPQRHQSGYTNPAVSGSPEWGGVKIVER
jgi:hypothetical protein